MKILEKEKRRMKYMLYGNAQSQYLRLYPNSKLLSLKPEPYGGNEAVQDIKALIAKAFELRNAQIAYSQFRINPHLAEGEQKLVDKERWIVYESGKHDEFWKEVEDIVSKIENRFRPRLI